MTGMSKYILDITGERYEMLTVLSYSHSKNGRSYWTCQCDCGRKKICMSNSLKTGRLTSCGCLQYLVTVFNGYLREINFEGTEFQEFKVIEKIHGTSQSNGMRYKCLCECGEYFSSLGSNIRKDTKRCRKCQYFYNGYAGHASKIFNSDLNKRP
jgi:hypothetical protein